MSAVTEDDVIALRERDFRRLVGYETNPHLSFAVHHERKTGRTRYITGDFGHFRVTDTILYVRHIRQYLANDGGDAHGAGDLVVFQADDVPVDVPSVSWETRIDWTSVGLVPDAYYFTAHGYEDYRPVLPAWKDRRRAIVWRGSTTGLLPLTLETLDDLPRYKLAKFGKAWGDKADIGLSSVVQAPDDAQDAILTQRLKQEGLLASYLPMEGMGHYQFIADIDGNSNSWNFMMKLRLGCCVLRVESYWKQWFHDRLVPWRHYVPVAHDLSDFDIKMEWCLAHPAQSEFIAREGKNFAEQMSFENEMRAAADTIFCGH